MNSSGSPVDHAALRVARVFATQRAAFDTDPYPSAARRRANIKALKRQISRYQDVLAGAMSRDFGFRAATESKMLDLLGSTLQAHPRAGVAADLHLRSQGLSGGRKRRDGPDGGGPSVELDQDHAPDHRRADRVVPVGPIQLGR